MKPVTLEEFIDLVRAYRAAERGGDESRGPQGREGLAWRLDRLLVSNTPALAAAVLDAEAARCA